MFGNGIYQVYFIKGDTNLSAVAVFDNE